MSEKYKFHNPDGVYFVTSTITDWVDIFTKSVYCNIVVDSLKYCQQNKGLVIHAWVIMSNHIHLIISRNSKPQLSEIMRDFKRFTSIELIKELQGNSLHAENPRASTGPTLAREFSRATSSQHAENPRASGRRNKWILELFSKAAKKIKRADYFKVWQDGNHPIELDSNFIMEQKLNYLHNNPVTAGIVYNPEDYVYSSAIDYSGGKGLIDLEILD